MDSSWLSLLFTRELSAFSRELDLFRDEKLIWSTVPGVSNSVGTLTLHVCGNLQHFVGAVLGGSEYVRDRDLEFSSRDIARAALQANLTTTTEVVQTVLAALPEERLLEEYPDVLGGLRVSTGLFLLHLGAHLAHHLGQAGYLRRALTGDNQSSGPIAVQALSGNPASDA